MPKDTRADAMAANAGIRRRARWQVVGSAHTWSESFLPDVARPRLSAVIACYLDAQAIPVMYERLTTVFSVLGVDHEIIFVNDGSPDDTQALLKALTAKDDRVIAVEHSRNFGS